MKRHRLYLTLLATAVLLSACVSDGTLVQEPATLMHYRQKPTDARLLALAKSYATAINNNKKEQTLRPGLYADYGVALAKLGCTEQANIMFNNEVMLFPNSTAYVNTLKASLAPAYASDFRTDTSEILMVHLDTIQVVLTPDELLEQEMLAKDPEYQKMLKEKQQAAKEQAAIAKEKEKKLKDKQKKAEQEAQAKAKAEAQKAKTEAKQAEMKAKAEAREAEKKAKEEAKKAEQKAKAEAQKAAQEAKKAEQKAKAEAQKAEQEAKKAEQKAKAEAQKAEQEAKKAEQKARADEQKAAEAAQKAVKQAENQVPKTDNEENVK